MELLVITIPRSDAVDDHQRGEIIIAMPDGHPWSDLEKSHPRAHIIRVPNMPDTHAADLLKPHPVSRVIGQKTPTRAYKLNLDLLPNPDEFKGGANRTQHIVELDVSHIENATEEISFSRPVANVTNQNINFVHDTNTKVA